MRSFKGYYTTGVWASAVAKAAVEVLITGRPCEDVEVIIPAGERVRLPVKTESIKPFAVVSGVKLSPEAEDVTHGAVIRARAEWWGRGVVIEGGRGIGVVTKPGLKLRVGEKAINPVPRFFILRNVADVLRQYDSAAGVRIVLEVEQGEEMARYTVNPKLGIVGGISILGTRGTVVPFSTKSFMDSIKVELSVARASGLDTVVFAPGRESLDFAKRSLDLPDEAFIAVGDYVYFAVRHAANMGFGRVHFFAQPAKMAKVAYGFKNTHAKYGKLPMDWLAKVLGVPEVANCNTVAQAFTFASHRWHLVEALAKERLLEWGALEAEVCTVAID